MQPQNIYPYMPPPPGYTYQRVHPRAGIAIAALVARYLSLVLQWALGVGIVLGILAIVFAVRALMSGPQRHGQRRTGLWHRRSRAVGPAAPVSEIASMGSSDTYYCNGRQVTQAEYDAC